MDRTLLAATAALFIITDHRSCQQSTAAASNCVSQYEDTTLTAAAFSRRVIRSMLRCREACGFRRQKLLYCNVARPARRRRDLLELREPLKNQSCQ